jgi:hypothetical protein
VALAEVEQLRRGVDERGGGPAGDEERVGDDVFEERDVGLDAADAEFAQGAAHAVEGDLVAVSAGDDLHEHRVVERRDDGAGETGGAVETDSEAAGRAVGLDASVVGHEFVFGILGGDAALEGETVARDVGLLRHADLGRMQRVALGDEDLGAHEIEAGDDLGDGMLNLDTRIHLDEELVAVEIVEEFDGAGVVVADLAGDADRGGAKGVDDIAGEAETRGDLDDLLVAALDGAVALVEMDDVAVFVAEDLDLDVFGARDVFFEEDGGVAEGAAGLGLGLVEEIGEIGGLVDDAHAATAAAEGGFDDEGKADFFGDFEGLGAVADGLLGAGEDGDFDFLG